MFRRCFHLSLLIFSIFLLSSCDKKTIPLPDAGAKQLLGRWEWVYTLGGWAGPFTPDSTGSTYFITFRSNGMFTRTEAGGEEISESYTIEKSEQPGYYEIDYEQLMDQSARVENDTLHLWDNCMDCGYYIFIRAQ